MKLKSTQLRRYNKVLHNGIEKTIECIGPAYVMFREDCPDENTFGEWVDLDEVEFIPLTNEKLKEVGFVQNGDYWNFKGVELYQMYNGDDTVGINAIPKNFFHEIQNLVWELERIEL